MLTRADIDDLKRAFMLFAEGVPSHGDPRGDIPAASDHAEFGLSADAGHDREDLHDHVDLGHHAGAGAWACLRDDRTS